MIHVRTAGVDDAAHVQRLLVAFGEHLGHDTEGGGVAGAARLLQEPLTDVLLGASVGRAGAHGGPGPGAAAGGASSGVPAVGAVGDDEPDLPAPEPQGLAVVRYRYGWWHDDLDANLEDLWVDAEARGTGLGRALLEETVARCRARGAARLLLDTREDNHAALALYRSTGFVSGDEVNGRRELPLRFAVRD